MRRVVITGIGPVTSTGIGKGDFGLKGQGRNLTWKLRSSNSLRSPTASPRRPKTSRMFQPIKAAAAIALVQPSIRNRFITKPFDLLIEVQHAALDISDHRVIG